MADVLKRWAEQLAEANAERANWLDDVLAGLLINGVTKDEIEVQHWPLHRTVVAVRGVPKYAHEWSVKQKK